MVEEMLLQQNPSKFAILLNHLKFWGELWSGSEFSKCQNRGIRLIVILRDMTTKKIVSNSGCECKNSWPFKYKIT